jgi:transcriptional regulator with XRE-family HTH domain
MTTTQTPHELVAAEIRAELARQRIPQSRLAAVLGISEVGVSRRMRGETPLDINELVKVGEFLGLDVSALLKDAAA